MIHSLQEWVADDSISAFSREWDILKDWREDRNKLISELKELQKYVLELEKEVT